MSAAALGVLTKVAERALAEVQPGMRIGLGTGRAAEAFIHGLAERVRGGLDVRCVATSERSERLARELGLPTTTLEVLDALDLAVDGADEVAPNLSLIKGLGGAHLRERVVAAEAARFVVLVTAEKLVTLLGERAPVPVEVALFAVPTAMRRLARVPEARTATRRLGADGTTPFVTDNGNAVIDVAIAPQAPLRAPELDRALRAVPGVVDTGLFLGMADRVIVGDGDDVRELVRPGR